MKSNLTDLQTELPIETGDGLFIAHYSQRGLAALEFPRQFVRPLRKPAVVSRQINSFHQLTAQALKQVLDGQAPGKLPPLDLTAGTEFQQRVWRELRKIATGRSRTYGEVAHAVGQPKAVRAVGGACGANPVPVLVPCHRVLAANQKPGGFSGGLAWKKKLLEREGIELTGW